MKKTSTGFIGDSDPVTLTEIIESIEGSIRVLNKLRTNPKVAPEMVDAALYALREVLNGLIHLRDHVSRI